MGEVRIEKCILLDIPELDVREQVQAAMVEDLSYGVIPGLTHHIKAALKVVDPGFEYYGIPGLTLDVADSPLSLEEVRSRTAILDGTVLSGKHGFVVKSHLPQIAINEIALMIASRSSLRVVDEQKCCS